MQRYICNHDAVEKFTFISNCRINSRWFAFALKLVSCEIFRSLFSIGFKFFS